MRKAAQREPTRPGPDHLVEGVPQRPGRAYLAIRYDDYGAPYRASCAARLVVEETIEAEMARRGWPWLCAVTPQQSIDPRDVKEERTVDLGSDPARVALLRKAVASGLCEPAVHGLTHHTWRQLPRYGTEFAGQARARQTEIIERARRQVETLAGVEVSVLVPPWNSFDGDTVAACADSGIGILSAGLLTSSPALPEVALVPCTVELVHLKQILERNQRLAGGSVAVLLMHATDFVTVDPEQGYLQVGELGPLLDRIVDRLKLEIVPVRRIPQLAGSDWPVRVTDAVALWRRYEYIGSLPILGGSIQRWMLPHVSAVLPAPKARRLRWSLRGLLLIWFLAVVLVAHASVAVMSDLSPSDALRSGVLVFGALLGIALAIYAGRNAFLKGVRKRWGSRWVGLRTWTALALGCALVGSALVQWAG